MTVPFWIKRVGQRDLDGESASAGRSEFGESVDVIGTFFDHRAIRDSAETQYCL